MQLYNSLEDKWYDLIDKIDAIIPISGIIDKIDEKAPSFAIFLIIIILILLFIGISIFSALSEIEVITQKEILVISEDNLPINNVQISVDSECTTGPYETTTNSAGKATVKTCSKEIIIRASKEGYQTYNKTITDSTEQIMITLKPAKIMLSTRILTIIVQNTQEQNINTATIQLTCGSDTNTYQNQPTAGWQIQVPQNCQNPQITANAPTYDQKSIILNPTDQRKVITLQKTQQQGTAYFETTTPKGPEITEITITNNLGQRQNLTTNSQGTNSIKLNSGTYNYTAMSTIGEPKTGTFNLEPNQNKLIEIKFEKTPEEADPPEQRKYIKIKLIDDQNQPIPHADITIIQEDGNVLPPIRKTNTLGITTRQPILNTEQKYKAIATANTYKTKIFDVILQNQNEYQKIMLNKGGSKLTIYTQNDLNNPEPRALIILTHPSLPKTPIIEGHTNRDAKIIVENLPPSNYTIFATDQTERDEANKNITITQNQDKNITLTLTTGTGNIRYNFYDTQKNPSDVQIKAYEKETQKMVIFQGQTTRNSYLTPTIKRNNQVIIETNDQNFIPHTTIPYQVNRGTSQKEIFLTKQDQLPNQNSVQLLLEQIYTANPITSNMNITNHARRIQQNTTYWLYFTLVLNNENEGTALANFYTNDQNFLINNVYSIDGTNITMANLKEETIIDPNSNQNITTQNAVQANARLTNAKAPKAIPIIIEIKTDQNATNVTINYEAIHVNDETQDITNSLEYQREFVIGQGECFSDCPPIFFNNYIKWTKENGQTETRPAKQFPENNILLIGDTYELITNIINKTDIDFETINIENTIPAEQINNITLNNDQNKVTKETTLPPLTTSQNTSIQLNPKNPSTITLNQKINHDALANINNRIRLTPTPKKQIKISISPQTFNEKTNYPLIIIQTTYDNGNKAKTNYQITINDNQIDTGITDSNGIAITNLNLTNFDKGDIIKIYANDSNGSLEGYLEKTITERYSQTITTEEEPCIEVDAQEITTLNKGQTTTFTINSTCSEQKTIFLHTELSTSQKTIHLDPNTSQTITTTATPRGELLGAYPLQIILINGPRYQQLKHIDIIIKDPSSDFELENAIFDLTTNPQINSYVTNKSYTTRKNNFYPRMEINTNSVELDYTKPTLPENGEYTFEAIVAGYGIESNVYGMIVSNISHAKQTNGRKCSSSNCRQPVDIPTIPESATDDALDRARQLCEEATDDGEVIPKPNAPLDESGELVILPDFVDYESGTILPPEGMSNIIIRDVDQNPNDGFDSVTTSAPNDIEKISLQENTSSLAFQGSNFSVGESVPTVGGGGSPTGAINDSPRTFSDRDWIIEYHWGLNNDVYGNITNSMPRPPGYRDFWGGGIDYFTSPLFTVLEIESENDKKAEVLHATYFGGGEYYVMYHLQGDRKEWYERGCCYSSGKSYTARIKGQTDNIRITEFLSKRVGVWRETVTIQVKEGEAQPVGYYTPDARPLPKGTNEDKVHGYAPNETWVSENSLLTAVCAISNDFVDPQKATLALSDFGPFPDQTNAGLHPHIEFDSTGKIGFIVSEDDIPADLEVYLRDGQYWAEYVGVPTMNDAQIDFTITKNNLMGTEYAILEIYDWVGNEIKKQSFQIKLQSEETTCISSEGDIGYTGPEFVPNLLFNWEWEDLPKNQCDRDNPNYTYCDATQFTIALLKKIEKIENLLNTGQLTQLSKHILFDAQLIKDTYNQNFLNDFDEYYSKPLKSSPIYQDNLRHYIKENKLEINSNMEYGGTYIVSISIPNLGTETNTLFDSQGKPIEKITVTLTPVQRAPNYSPFYELPFNGPIGQSGRDGYGVVADSQIKLDNTIPLVTQGNGKTNLTINTPQGLKEKQNAILLNYTKNQQFTFNPVQPNPIIWTIESETGKVNTSHTISGANNLSQTNWTLLGSNMGGTTCQDFERNATNLFTAKKSGENFTLNWNGSQAGTINLGTVIFTPQNTENKIIPDSQTQMKGQPTTTTHNDVILGYYDSIQKQNYTHLKGLFESIKNRETCISTTPETTKIYYNPEYISNLLKNVDQSSNTCGFEISSPFFSTLDVEFERR